MPHQETQHRESRLPHRLAVVLACATFPLVWVGGLVTTTDAGMAVPDWPGTYGYNLFLYPWQTWLLGPWDLFIEHGHRLLAATVGMLTIATVIGLWLRDSRRWVLQVGFAALALVIVQGLLGGMRVWFDERLLAMLHACTGPLFFVLAVSLVVFTSRTWLSRTGLNSKQTSDKPIHPQAQNLRVLALLTFAFTYLQLGLGALLRHIPVAADPSFFATIVRFHLLFAGVLVLHVMLLSGLALWSFRHHTVLRNLAIALAGSVSAQVALGLSTWVVKYSIPNWPFLQGLKGLQGLEGLTLQAGSLFQTHIITAHVAVGSLMLVTSAALALFSWRLVPVAGRQAVRSKLLMELAL